MDGEIYNINPDDLIGLTEDEIIHILDASWPWPLSYVQEWFENLWNSILSWIEEAVGWIADRLAPVWQTIWGWLQSGWDIVKSHVTSAVHVVWDWLQSGWNYVVSGVTGAFSTIWSWLQSGWDYVVSGVTGAFSTIWSWLQSGWDYVVSGVTGAFSTIWSWLQSGWEIIISHVSSWFTNLWSYISDIWHDITAAIGRIYSWFSNNFIDPFLDWLLQFPQKFFEAFMEVNATILQNIASFLAQKVLPFIQHMVTYLMTYLRPVFDALGSIVSSVLQILLTLVQPVLQLITAILAPVFTTLADWFESLGPVAPQPGGSMMSAVSALITVTLAGLGALTIAGETVGFWKHVGMGHLSAIIYDVSNYKVLTAAFMGVFAGIYIKTPLTYYYNKIARPNLPSERALGALLAEQVITEAEYYEGMRYEGYSDAIIDRLKQTVDSRLAPRMLNYLATAGIIDDQVIDRELKRNGYALETIPYIKTWLQRAASGEVKTLSVSTAMSRYREGMDDESALRRNLIGLGVSESNLDRYVFAAQLMERYDYQLDLKAYYIDSYHRRDSEESDLRRNLTTIGIRSDRLDLIVWAQQIKRVAAAKAAEDPSIAIQFDTIRDRRKKELITRDEEIKQLVAIGKELSYAIAIADNDDVAIAAAKSKVEAIAIPKYETDAGKVQVDTIRRLRRSGQISADEEINALTDLEMSVDLATAIADNDALRIKQTSSSSE